MSQENVEFVRRGYEALEHGDLEAFKELARDRLDPEFEFHHVPDAEAAGAGGGSLTIGPLPGSILISGFAPTIEGVRSVLHPGVT